MARVILELSEQRENQQLLKNWRTLFEPGGDYNETMCADFHQLLLATLLAYGHALIVLANNSEALQTFDQKY